MSEQLCSAFPQVFTLDDLDHGEESLTQQQRHKSGSDSRTSRPRVPGFYGSASSAGVQSLSRVELEMGPQHKIPGSEKVKIPGRVRTEHRSHQQDRGAVSSRAFVLDEEEGEDLEKFDPPSPQQSGNDHKRFI